jgi:hypothetical protein
VADVGRRLRLDAATAEVVGRLAAAEVETLLLKGPSVARWLYPDPDDRPYGDVDLLVGPGDAPAAGGVLDGLGFSRTAPDLSRSRPRAAVEWRRARDGVEIDLHETFPGVEGDLWAGLWPNHDRLEVGGREVMVPSIAGRVLLIGLHAANHGAAARQPMADLELALATIAEHHWAAAATLARDVNALAAFAAGLGLCPDGAALVAALGAETAPSVRTAVTVESPAEAVRGVALGIDWLVTRPGWRAKLAYMAEKVWPPAEWIVERYPLTSGRRFGVARARARRLAWLAVHLPSGARAWLRARRRTRRDGEG